MKLLIFLSVAALAHANWDRLPSGGRDAQYLKNVGDAWNKGDARGSFFNREQVQQLKTKFENLRENEELDKAFEKLTSLREDLKNKAGGRGNFFNSEQGQQMKAQFETIRENGDLDKAFDKVASLREEFISKNKADDRGNFFNREQGQQMKARFDNLRENFGQNGDREQLREKGEQMKARLGNIQESIGQNGDLQQLREKLAPLRELFEASNDGRQSWTPQDIQKIWGESRYRTRRSPQRNFFKHIRQPHTGPQIPLYNRPALMKRPAPKPEPTPEPVEVEDNRPVMHLGPPDSMPAPDDDGMMRAQVMPYNFEEPASTDDGMMFAQVMPYNVEEPASADDGMMYAQVMPYNFEETEVLSSTPEPMLA